MIITGCFSARFALLGGDMDKLYVDESGSMTIHYTNDWPYFVICAVKAKDPVKLRKSYKRFVTKNMEALKAANKGKMFKGEKFLELKGNEFTPQLKRDFVNHFCQKDNFELFYIVIDNKKIDAKFYENKARSFNYILKLALICWINKGLLSKDGLHLQLDERNEKTETKYFLQNYLNTELRLLDITTSDTTVEYFDSCNNHIIQIADVFANIKYSDLLTNNYSDCIEQLSNTHLKHQFVFPLK